MATTSSVATGRRPRIAAILTVALVVAGIVAVALLNRREPSGTSRAVTVGPLRPPARPKASVEVAVILVFYGEPTAERAGTGRTRSAALEIAERVLSRLKAGESFERLQLEISDDVQADGKTLYNSGTYTWAEDDRRIPEMARRVAFATPVGRIHPSALDLRYAFLILRRDL